MPIIYTSHILPIGTSPADCDSKGGQEHQPSAALHHLPLVPVVDLRVDLRLPFGWLLREQHT